MAAVSFSGIASGIDGDAIIKALLDAKALASQPMKNVVEANKVENDALAKLTTKLLAVRDAVKDFRTLAGSSISKRGTSSDDDAVSITASSSSLVSSTTVEVLNLAKSATFSFDTRFANTTDPIAPGLAAPAKMTFTLGQGSFAKTYEVEITNTTTLGDVITRINEETASKVVASAVNVGTESAPQYALLISGTETGLEKGAMEVSIDPAISASGIFETSTSSQAEDSVFTIAGLGTITRSSNRINGVIPGVTLELKKENVGPVLVSVTDDADKTTAKMETMVGAINELITFIKENDTITRGEKDGRITNSYGSLAKVRVDNQAVNSIREAIADTNSQGIGLAVTTFADLGVTTERDGSYKFDKDKFIAALGADATGASTILTRFGDKLANTNGLIDQYTKFQGQIDIAKSANDAENQMLNDRLDRIQTNMDKQAMAMKLMFANLETKIGKLNSTADALSSMIAATAKKK